MSNGHAVALPADEGVACASHPEGAEETPESSSAPAPAPDAAAAAAPAVEGEVASSSSSEPEAEAEGGSLRVSDSERGDDDGALGRHPSTSSTPALAATNNAPNGAAVSSPTSPVVGDGDVGHAAAPTVESLTPDGSPPRSPEGSPSLASAPSPASPSPTPAETASQKDATPAVAAPLPATAGASAGAASTGASPPAPAGGVKSAPPKGVATTRATPPSSSPGGATSAKAKGDCALFTLRACRAMLPLLPKRHAGLREEMQAVVALLDGADGPPQAIPPPAGMAGPAGAKAGGAGAGARPLQVYAYLLRSACESGEQRVVPLALDGMQKLMSFGGPELADEMPGSLSLTAFAKHAKMAIPKAAEGEAHPWKGRTVGVLTEIVTAICSTSSHASNAQVSDSVTLQTLKALLTAVTERCVHGKALRLAVSTIFHITTKSHSPANQATAKSTITRVVNSVFQHLDKSEMDASREKARWAAEHKGGEGEAWYDRRPRDASTGMTQEESDAAYVFNFLAGAMETVDVTEDTPPEAPERRVALSSLELVRRLLAPCSLSFRESYPFLNAVRQHLLSLTMRCLLHPVPQILQTGVALFSSIAVSLKHHFKEEVAHILTNIVMRLVNLSTASYDQRYHLMHGVLKLLQNPQFLVDLYVNYDCNINCDNVFASTVSSLSKFVLTHQLEPDWITPKHSLTLKLLGVQCIGATLKSLDTWVKLDGSNAPPVFGGGFAASGRPAARASDTSSNTSPFSEASSSQHQLYTAPTTFLDTQKRLALKKVLEQASEAMLEKPKRGLKILLDNKLVEPEDPDSVAQALQRYKRIDRHAVGDFLGDPDQLDVLTSFCRLEDYSTLTLDEAIRNFLSRFALPKEGQKIERVLEYFAHEFYEMARSSGRLECKTDEAVFVLAVGIVMLNTDLHNPKIEKKMKLERFKTQFTGVNGGGDFPEDYLETLYHNILTRPMKDFTATASLDAGSQEENTSLFYSAFMSKREKKTAQFVADAQRLLTQNLTLANCERPPPFEADFDEYTCVSPSYAGKVRAGEPRRAEQLSLSATEQFYFARDAEHVRLMLEVCWQNGFLPALSHVFNNANPVAYTATPPVATVPAPGTTLADHPTVLELARLSIDGMSKAVHLTASFDLHMERESFVRFFCSMTGAGERHKLVAVKNVLAAKAFMKLPFMIGDHLNGSWLCYVRTLSDLEHYRSLGVNLKRGTPAPPTSAGAAAAPGAGGAGTGVGAPTATEQANARAFMVNIEEESINKVISHSMMLSPAGLKEFMCHLCTVALDELQRANPRSFLLRQVVSVASDNMGQRILPVFSDVARLFVEVGTHTSSSIAENGVDCLRQLVVKAIANKELQACRIQPELLGPFYSIMESSLPGKNVRELILRCLLQLVQSLSPRIGEGFPVLMKTLISGVHRHKDVAALTMTIEILKRLVADDAFVHILPYVEDLVYCITFIASDTKLNPEAAKGFSSGVLFALPAKVEAAVARRAAAAAADADAEAALANPGALREKVWGQLFECFVYLALDPDEDVRRKSVAALQGALSPPSEEGGARAPLCEEAWEAYATVFLSTLLLNPQMSPLSIPRACNSYAHFRYFGVGGEIERVSQKEWHDKVLPMLVKNIVVAVARSNCTDPIFLRHVPDVVAVLSKAARVGAAREVQCAVKAADSVLDACCLQLGAQEWSAVCTTLVHLFRHSFIRTSLLAQYRDSPSAGDDSEPHSPFFDPTVDGDTDSDSAEALRLQFPRTADLCPPRYTLKSAAANVRTPAVVHHDPAARPPLPGRATGAGGKVVKHVCLFVLHFFCASPTPTLTRSLTLFSHRHTTEAQLIGLTRCTARRYV